MSVQPGNAVTVNSTQITDGTTSTISFFCGPAFPVDPQDQYEVAFGRAALAGLGGDECQSAAISLLAYWGWTLDDDGHMRPPLRIEQTWTFKELGK